MEKEMITLVVAKLEKDGRGIYARVGVSTLLDAILGEVNGEKFEDFFVNLCKTYKIEEMFEKLAFRFAELRGDQIDVVVDNVELERQIKEAREHEI